MALVDLKASVMGTSSGRKILDIEFALIIDAQYTSEEEIDALIKEVDDIANKLRYMKEKTFD
jgi:hypothetical protein